MAAFPTLLGIEALTLLVDHDANGAGEHAAGQCARRWRDAGKEVIQLMPGELGDFNDLVKS
jgi:putative DNA primase/helicase